MSPKKTTIEFIRQILRKKQAVSPEQIIQALKNHLKNCWPLEGATLTYIFKHAKPTFTPQDYAQVIQIADQLITGQIIPTTHPKFLEFKSEFIIIRSEAQRLMRELLQKTPELLDLSVAEILATKQSDDSLLTFINSSHLENKEAKLHPLIQEYLELSECIAIAPEKIIEAINQSLQEGFPIDQRVVQLLDRSEHLFSDLYYELLIGLVESNLGTEGHDLSPLQQWLAKKSNQPLPQSITEMEREFFS